MTILSTSAETCKRLRNYANSVALRRIQNGSQAALTAAFFRDRKQREKGEKAELLLLLNYYSNWRFSWKKFLLLWRHSSKCFTAPTIALLANRVENIKRPSAHNSTLGHRYFYEYFFTDKRAEVYLPHHSQLLKPSVCFLQSNTESYHRRSHIITRRRNQGSEENVSC